ncbi:MAG: hypothetical protein EBS10_00215 [Acidimicrobiia bacterium]|nr:hypothetical protein [Acidimicrobiia bacterium]
MFTTGSKLLIGSSVLALVATLLFGILDGGLLGSVGLISATVALSVLAGINVFTRDANVGADEVESFGGAASAAERPGSSMWPFTIGLAAVTVTLGLVTYTAIFVLGLILLMAGLAEWLVQAWSERASSERDHNAEVRARILHPVEMPAAAAIGLGIVIYAFSRVMLGVPSKTSTIVAFSVVATVVLAVGAFIGSKRTISAPAMTGGFAIAAVVLVSGGAVAGLNGEREIKEHHTTAYYAAKDKCGVEEISADEHASQTVAGKASSAAEIFLTESGSIEFQMPGDSARRSDALQLPRSNPNNLLMRNESSEPRRFVIDLADGYEGSPPRMCTQIIEEGGVQLLTVKFAVPSFAPEVEAIGGYRFTVPGVDSAALEVIVP